MNTAEDGVGGDNDASFFNFSCRNFMEMEIRISFARNLILCGNLSELVVLTRFLMGEIFVNGLCLHYVSLLFDWNAYPKEQGLLE
jgi:hypothetical protein